MAEIQQQIYKNFIQDDRWRYLLSGLRNTLIITVFALVLGVAIGFLLALVRVIHDSTGKLKALNMVAKLYLTVIRGIPAVIQLMIMYYVILVSVNSSVVVAIIAFGVNSGAYVAEIFRAGIMSIDTGQMEAGRSLGLNYRQTMLKIIMPQAVKNILPSLGNEFITLLKETSISGYIAIRDLTKGGDIIRSLTYSPFPLVAVALVYLLLVIILQTGVNRLERRLRKSDRH